jgi:NodT family efflux transporter outer membrane factor (OMF) lipoprotein
MKNYLLFPFLSVLALASLSGCVSVGPDYEPPPPSVPDAWHTAVQQEIESKDPALQTWWTVFDDDILDGLIVRVSTNNLNLKTAIARIEQAAALRGVAASQYWPDIVAGGSAQAIQNTRVSTPAGADRRDELYRAGLSMAWELDLWGRIRRSVESADASLQAQVEDYRDIMVVLYSSVAANYIQVRTLQKRIVMAENNLKNQKETVKLTKNRFDAGLVPALDVFQARLNQSRTESLIPPLRQRLTEAINRLSLLAGEMPYALLQELEAPRPIPAAKKEIAFGVPAELLRQRPDIRRAERTLAAKNAQIGATQAELYPTLALPGSLAIEVLGSEGSLDSGNVTYGFGPQLRWNIFNGRRIRSQVDATKAETRAALHTYEQTVLKALEETENAMSAYKNERSRIQNLEVAATSAQKSVELVTELYKSGLTDFQNVLNMERDLLTQEDDLAKSQGEVSLNLVAIYKALGGGWSLPQAE